jgi:hypothetical protein
MKIVLLVPDGVAVRNYIYSDFIKELHQANFEVILYHQIPIPALQEIQNIQGDFISEYRIIPNFKEGILSRIARESCAYARLLYNAKTLKNKTILQFWNGNSTSYKRVLLLRISELLGLCISKRYSWILKIEKEYDASILNNSATKLVETELAKLKPDYILNLHQRAVTTAPIIAAAKNLKIKNGTVIFSWDNIPKARLISRYDSYFVWSDLMKLELETVYPEIKSINIKVVGTPQFEFYFNDKFQLTKQDFFATYNLDSNKRTVCFSANDASSPYEAQYLEDLCEEISKIEEVNQPQILFRRCPVDLSSRFDSVMNKYPNLLFPIHPDWRIASSDQNTFTEIYPSFLDIGLLVNTVLHSDVVVNLGSTMAHDFAVFNKPCLYLNYDPIENSSFKVKDVFDFQHFRSMQNLNAVGWINSKEEFQDKIQRAINNPENTGEDRMQWIQKIVRHPLQNNSSTLANEIITLCTSV